MYAALLKLKTDNKSRAVANSIGQRKSADRKNFGIVDNRSEAKAQKNLQLMMNESSKRGRLPVHPVLQRVTNVTNANMATVAQDVTNSDQNTVAITKEDDEYKWYSQHNIGAQKAYIADEYPNLEVGLEGNVATGVHAEMLAVDQTGANIARIAASRPICKRCQEALSDLGITRVNNGTNYTSDWVAPDHFIDIDVEDNFPAIARDSNAAGTSGRRWIREEGVNSQVAKSVWDADDEDRAW